MLSRGIGLLRAATRALRHPSSPHTPVAKQRGAQHSKRTLTHSSASLRHAGTKLSAQQLDYARQTVQRILSDVFTQFAKRTVATSAHGIPGGALNRGAHTFPIARSIHQGLSSSSARGFVANAAARSTRGGGGSFMPRAPLAAPPKAGVGSVGLGTARNFSSGASKPLFQNLVHNVPVALRALSEVEIDIRSKKDTTAKRLVRDRHAATAAEKLKQQQKRQLERHRAFQTKHETFTTDEEELSVYFPIAGDSSLPTPSEPFVTTLTVPLGPSTEHEVQRSPLPGTYAQAIEELMSMHQSYSSHALRVTSLFSALDRAEVWSRGATCQAFDLVPAEEYLNPWAAESAGANASRGIVRVLEVVFDGWTESMVKDVIGPFGFSWCTVTSVRKTSRGMRSTMQDEVVDEEAHSARASSSPVVGAAQDAVVASRAYVMPTLDLSASFGDTEAVSVFARTEDVWSDAGDEDDRSLQPSVVNYGYGTSDESEEREFGAMLAQEWSSDTDSVGGFESEFSHLDAMSSSSDGEAESEFWYPTLAWEEQQMSIHSSNWTA